MSARDVLNKLKWHPDFEISNAEITIVHRGAPRDRKTISGEDVLDLETGFMKVEGKEKPARIPYHRVLKIEIPEEVLYQDSP